MEEVVSWIGKAGLGMRRGGPGAVGCEGGVGPWEIIKDAVLWWSVVLISHPKGFRGPLVIRSVHFRDFLAFVL